MASIFPRWRVKLLCISDARLWAFLSRSCMDRIFANFVDQIALAGHEGLRFFEAIPVVLGPQPDPAIVAWVINELRKRNPKSFTSPDFGAPAESLHITACETLRNRALGYNVLEHGNIQPQARTLLESVGRSGTNGVLQSDLASLCNLSPVMVHHYLVSLLNRDLVAKKKVVLTRTKEKQIFTSNTSPFNQTDITEDNESLENLESTPLLKPDKTHSVTVTYTAVIVLSRFGGFIRNTNLTKTFKSLQSGTPVPAPGAPAAVAELYPSSGPVMNGVDNISNSAASVSIIDLTGDERMHRVIDALRASNVRADRDLKMICMPDSERCEMSLDVFRRRRHRMYRTLRGRLIRFGLAKIVQRNCRSISGKTLGRLPCLIITDLGRTDSAVQKAFGRQDQNGGGTLTTSDPSCSKPKMRASSLLPRELLPLLSDWDGPSMLAEVDLVQQVFDVLVRAGAKGISVPELDGYLDGGSGRTGISQKRIRNIIKVITRKEPLVESQLFEGKTMFVRFSLARFVSESDPNFRKCHPTGDFRSDSFKDPPKRRKTGITTLGEQRQSIILSILAEKRVIVLESLGREVATVENSGITRVDQKVMRRIVNDLVEKKKIKIITATKPTIKEGKRWQSIRLAALPDVHEHSPEVRRLVNTAVDRALYGTYENGNGEVIKKGDELSEDDSESLGTVKSPHGSPELDLQTTPYIRNGNHVSDEVDDDDEPVIVENALERPSKSSKSENKRKAAKRKRVSSANNLDDIESEEADLLDTVESRPPKRKCPSVTFVEAGTDVKSTDRSIARTIDFMSSVIAAEERNGITKSNGNNDRHTLAEDASRSGVAEYPDKNLTSLNDESSTQAADSPHTSRGQLMGKLLARSSKKKNKKTQRNEVCVQNASRDQRKPRIARLRAIDYGWMKGCMARARLFHKLLYKIAMEREQQRAQKEGMYIPEPDAENETEVAHITVDEGERSQTIGELNIYNCFSEMTVGEYAAIVGMCYEHGDLIESIKGERVDDVINIIKPEVTSQHACRRIKSLVQLLSKLCLIQAKEESIWTLSGSGVIWDFGRGMPPGVVSHAVPFNTAKGVDMYWKELRQFSVFKMPKERNLTQWNRKREDGRARYIRDLYQPVSWETGLYQELPFYDQLLFECILQRLCGLDIPAETLNLATAPITITPLREFTVDELVDELDRVSQVNDFVGKRQRYATISEGLLQYARMRSKANIPRRLAELSENFDGSKTITTTPKNMPIEYRSYILRMRRMGSIIEAEEISKAIMNPTCHEYKKPTKALVKRLKSSELPLITVHAETLVLVLRAVVQYGSVLYCCDDVDFVDWLNAVAAVRTTFRKTDIGSTADEAEATFQAVTGLCHCAFLCSAFDILSSRIVFKVRERAIEDTLESEIWSRDRVSKVAGEVMVEWTKLDDAMLGILKEVKEEVYKGCRIVIEFINIRNKPGSSIPTNSDLDFLLCGNQHVSTKPRLLSQRVHIISSRFRRIAYLRLHQNIQLGLLFKSKDGEAEEQSNLDDKMKETCRWNGKGCWEAWISWDGRKRTKSSFGNARIAIANTSVDHVSKEQNSNLKTEEVSIMERRGMILKRSQNSNNVRIQTRVELTELVVITVLRQDRFHQWSKESMNLLNNMNEDMICLARDRQILRGAVYMIGDYDERERQLVLKKPEKLTDPITFLYEEGVKEKEEEWVKDLSSISSSFPEEGFDLANSKLFKEIQTPNPSLSASALNILTRMVLLDEEDSKLELSPCFTTDENEKNEKFIVKARWKGGLEPSQLHLKNNVAKRREMKISGELCDFLATTVKSCGWHGITLKSLLLKVKESGKWKDPIEIMDSLNEVKERRGIQRFAIISETEDWKLLDDSLLICSEFCSSLRCSRGWINGWTHIDGRIDVSLVRETATVMMDLLMRKPGIDVRDVAKYIGERYAWMSRRAAVDLLFALVKKGFVTSDLIVFENGRWVDFDMGVKPCDTDSIAVLTWGKNVRVCVKVVARHICGGRDWLGTDDKVSAMFKSDELIEWGM